VQSIPLAEVGNEDFVLGYCFTSTHVVGRLVVEEGFGDEPSTFAVLLCPPLQAITVTPRRKEIVFLLDVSGSMDGTPMRLAVDAMVACLRQLQTTDTFALCLFNHETMWWNGHVSVAKPQPRCVPWPPTETPPPPPPPPPPHNSLMSLRVASSGAGWYWWLRLLLRLLSSLVMHMLVLLLFLMPLTHVIRCLLLLESVERWESRVNCCA
jgi:hypothetical protein